MLLKSVLLTLCLAVASLAATVADVNSDLTAISSQVTTLDNSITSFPASGGSLIAALGIHTTAGNLGTAINKGTSDVNSAPPFSETDGKSILATVQGFEASILHALQQIVVKKPAFQGLPIGGIPALIKADLVSLNASTFAFEGALIASAPADLKTEAAAIKTAIDSAFVTAITAYN